MKNVYDDDVIDIFTLNVELSFARHE